MLDSRHSNRISKTTKALGFYKIQTSPTSSQTARRCRMWFRATIKRSSTLEVRFRYSAPDERLPIDNADFLLQGMARSSIWRVILKTRSSFQR